MVLGAELIIILSLAVVLAIVFVALLCDFLKGNNEQLHQRNIELRVRQDERDRMGLSQPLAWLQGLAALGRHPGMAEAAGLSGAGSVSGAPAMADTPVAAGMPAEAAPAAARSKVSEQSRVSDVAAEPGAMPAETKPNRYDEMKATARSTSWASKEELEQLAGRAARIRARHEAAQKSGGLEEEVASKLPEAAAVTGAAALGLVTAPLLRGRASEVTPIRETVPEVEAGAEQIKELDALAAAPAMEPEIAVADSGSGEYGADSEWEFTIEGEDPGVELTTEVEEAVSKSLAESVESQAAARSEAIEEAGQGDDGKWRFANAEAWDPEAEAALAPPATVSFEEPRTVPVEEPQAALVEQEASPGAVLESAGQPADSVFGEYREESMAVVGPLETDPAVLRADAEQPQGEPIGGISSEVIARGTVDTDIWDIETWDLASEPKASSEVPESSPEEEGSFQDIASEIFSGYSMPAAGARPALETESLLGAEARFEPEPIRRPIAARVETPFSWDSTASGEATDVFGSPTVSEAMDEVAGEHGQDSPAFDASGFDLELPVEVAPEASDDPVAKNAGDATGSEFGGEWSWSRDEDAGPGISGQNFTPRDSTDVAALFASGGVPASEHAPAQPEEISLWRPGHEPVASAPEPAAYTSEAFGQEVAEPAAEDFADFTPGQPPAAPTPAGAQIEDLAAFDQPEPEPIPAGLQPAEVLTSLIESQASFKGVAVAVGINDYESLKDKLASSSGSDSLTALNRMIVSMLGPQDFAARFADEEFILLYPGESGSAAQRRLFQVSEKLWDFQLRSLGSLSIMFSWGGLEVNGETLADSVMAARERMYQTRRSRKTTQVELGVTRRRVVNG